MTSNIGARQLKDFGTGVGFGTKAREDAQDEVSKGVIESALKKAFAPEFLNRIDDVVMFNTLQKEDIHKIIDIELSNLFGRVNGLGYSIKITDAAKDYIVEKGYDSNYGARPLKRAIQKYLEDPMAEEIIKSNLSEGDEIEIDYNKEKDEVIVSTHKPKKTKSKKEDKA
jgi:ATP-dependent Clp protease ATP-binding subunit ClpC